MPDSTLSISSIASRIHALNLNWLTKDNELTALSDAERHLRLGAVPPAGKTLTDREAVAAAQVHALTAGSYPAAYDARTAGWVTPIEDQGGCGSCVAFGTTATVESAVRIANNNRNLAVDLSEAQVFYCYGKAAGATCGSGWWPDGALNGYKTGVVDAACFPYTAGDQNCNLCSNWKDRLTAISGWTLVNSVTISVVGYNDAGKYWICKNSWGTGWGESGFFCIAYNTCGLDSEMWAINGVVDTGWRNNQAVRGLWAIDQDFNAWAYLSDYGWKKLSNNTDNIFYDMLSQIMAAKASGHAVNVHLTNGVIDQIYS
jgi:C1A family cysteine protease